jgi:hypothetical protein
LTLVQVIDGVAVIQFSYLLLRSYLAHRAATRAAPDVAAAGAAESGVPA